MLKSFLRPQILIWHKYLSLRHVSYHAIISLGHTHTHSKKQKRFAGVLGQGHDSVDIPARHPAPPPNGDVHSVGCPVQYWSLRSPSRWRSPSEPGPADVAQYRTRSPIGIQVPSQVRYDWTLAPTVEHMSNTSPLPEVENGSLGIYTP